MRETKPGSAPHASGRRIAGRAQDAAREDPYEAAAKPAGGTVCGACGAVFAGGRWTWQAPETDAPASLCPACRRIADDAPAGLVAIGGAYALARRDEIVAIARHCETAENAEHPLNRIMSLRVGDDGIEIATTDVHLPRRIGNALERAHDGSLHVSFDEDGRFVRVAWRREG